MMVIYTNNVNGLGVNWFATVDECLKHAMNSKALNYKYYLISEQLPMYFYHAFYWNDSLKTADINISIAKEIKKDEYRGIRDSILNKLDVLFMKSIETDNLEQKSKIVIAKNKLRNVTSEELPNDWRVLLTYYPSCFKEALDLIQN